MQDKNIRLRLLAVMNIIKETKRDNPVSIQDIIRMINQRYLLMIPVSDRRAIQRDLQAIDESGIPVSYIVKRSNKRFYYCELE
jgi:ABC-type sugar transport system substrate-binding protein